MVHPRYRLFCTGLLCLLYILDHPSARLNVISHHQTEVLYSTVLPSNKPHLSHFTRHIVLTSIPSLPYFLASSHYFILPAPCIQTSHHPIFCCTPHVLGTPSQSCIASSHQIREGVCRSRGKWQSLLLHQVGKPAIF